MSVKYPRYYEVDDIPVKMYVDPDTNKVFTVNDLGNPFDMAKVIVEGNEISKAKYKVLTKARQEYLSELSSEPPTSD